MGDTYELSEREKNAKKFIWIAIAIILLLIMLFMIFFIKKEYRVTFDTDGGNQISSVTVKEGDKINKPDDPTKENYIFVGWYYNDQLYDFDKPVKQDITLKAKWELLNASEVENVILNTTELSLSPDGTATLIATLLPENAKEVKLIWSSSDESIVTVDENGNIKALKEGTATIAVSTEDGKFTASCVVKVTNNIIKVEGVTISGAKEVTVGQSIKLSATVTPDNATNKVVTWKSSNSSIAKVDQNGNVTGLKSGKVTITVKTTDGGYEATYTVTVKQNENTNNNTPTTPQTPAQPSTPSTPSEPNTSTTPTNPTNPSKPDDSKPSKVEVTSVSLNKTNETLTEGETLTLIATVNPSNATDKTVSWSSSDSNIASVVNGKVTAKKAGTVTITVTTTNGKTATCTITVKEKEASYSIELTPIAQEGTGNVMQYTFVVYKNGNPFNDYQSFTIGKRGARKGSKQISLEDKTNKSASLLLSNGSTVTASVTYK